MKERFVMLAAIIALVLPTAICLRDSAAFASSDFSADGSFSVSNYSPATCSVFTGPRTISEGGASLAPNEFLLRIDSDGLALELEGNFEMEKSGALKLSPNEALAENSFETILQSQSGDPSIGFRLEELQASVRILPVASGQTQALCNVHLTGSVVENSPGTVPTGNPGDPAADLSFTIRNPVTLHFNGTGTYYAGINTSSSSVTVAADPPMCSDPTNLQPNSQSCSGTNCLLDFAGYKWWTYNQFYPGGSGFWNNNNVWSPRGANVQGDGLHLSVMPTDLGDGKGNTYKASEVILLQNAADGSPARLGFGTYLVTAKIITASSWDTMDPNVSFGVFTYEKEKTGTTDNPNREIDLAEVSRWGNPAGQPCQDKRPKLCVGNSQFTLQDSAALPDDLNVNRYSINPGVNEITLVMEWTAANQPVSFKQYDGNFDLSHLPDTPDNHWTSDPTLQNRFIPDSNCQRFLLNFWMGKYRAAVNGINPPPERPQELVVERFQFNAKPTPSPTPLP